MCAHRKGPRIAVFTDLEGISGVDDPKQVIPCSAQYQIYITEEANAAIRGFRKGGAEKIYIIDSHGGGKWPNIRADLLDKEAELISGLDIRKRGRMVIEAEIGKKVEAAARLGNHARRQTRGFMSHTVRNYPPIRIKINGVEIGEIYLYILWAGSHKLPMIMLSGDDVAMNEAAFIAPYSERVVVKKSLSRSRCDLVPFDKAIEMIEEAAFRAVSRIEDVPIYNPPPPGVRYRSFIQF